MASPEMRGLAKIDERLHIQTDGCDKCLLRGACDPIIIRRNDNRISVTGDRANHPDCKMNYIAVRKDSLAH